MCLSVSGPDEGGAYTCALTGCYAEVQRFVEESGQEAIGVNPGGSDDTKASAKAGHASQENSCGGNGIGIADRHA